MEVEAVITLSVTQDLKAEGGHSLLEELKSIFRRITPKEATTVTIGFSKHEITDLAFRTAGRENLQEKISHLPGDIVEAGTLVKDLKPEAIIKLLVLNAALATRHFPDGVPPEVRCWNSYQDDGRTYCISVALPAVPERPHVLQPMRSG